MACDAQPAATTAHEALRGLWLQAGLPPEALAFAQLTGADRVLPSSFAVGVAAQASIAAAALAACELAHQRDAARQLVAVDMAHAAIECTGWFSLDGQAPDLWDALSGLYRCADGFVRIHANFAHHRDGALRLLGLEPGQAVRADIESALQRWRALDFEEAAARAGLVATALRSFEAWGRSERPCAGSCGLPGVFRFRLWRIAGRAAQCAAVAHSGRLVAAFRAAGNAFAALA